MKILIVDDSPDDRTVLRYMVKMNGHEAIEAVDGSDGLEKAKSTVPDLIISDALMPVMDGFQFLREVKQDPVLRSIPFIFYSSSYKDYQDVRLAMSLGADTYVLKPVEPDVLWQKIEALLKAGKTEKTPIVPLIEEDAEYLKRYSAVVATKLEEKVHELEWTLAERDRAVTALKNSEARFHTLFECVPDAIFIADLETGRICDVNQSALRLMGMPYEQLAGLHQSRLHPAGISDQTRASFQVHASEAREGKVSGPFEHRIVRSDGTEVPVEIVTQPVMMNGVLMMQGVFRDISERKKAEQERQANLKFLESMDKVNRAIQGANDVDSMMSDVLDTVLSIFDCDRAFLLYPCDPEAATWSVPMERTRPEYPGVLALGLEVPTGEDVARTFRLLLDTDGPVKFGPESPNPLPGNASERFGFISLMSMALRPNVGKPWQFGLHQCSYARVWTHEEKRLLQEIGRRLADGLTTLLSQRELRESEEKYRRLVDTSNEGIWALDPDVLTTFVNARMADLLGYRVEEMIGRPFTDFMFNEDTTDHLQKMEERRKGRTDYYERRFRRKDGSTVWTLVSAVPVFDAENKFNGSFGMFTDITERKMAEQALKKSELFLSSIVENIPNMLFVKDAGSLKFVRFNRAGEQLLGYSREELLGKSDHDFFPKEEADFFTAKDREVLSASRLVDIPEERIRTRDRRERILHTKKIPITDDAGKPQYLLGISEDITERIRSEEALKKSESFNRNILESVSEGFVIVDREFRIQSANRAFSEFVKLPAAEIVGRHCYAVSHHVDKPCFTRGEQCAVRQTFETGASHSASHLHTTATGDKQYVEIKSYPITDASGAVVSAIETITDITERKGLEDQLRQAQKMEAVGTLAGGVAHDFNNILTAIMGYGHIAKTKLQPDDPIRAAIDQILASSERAAHLTQGLLAFSRKQVISLKPVEVNSVIRSVEKLLRRLIGEDVELTMRPAERDLIILADAGQIEQVLMNLATNARDAMPDGGTLSITTEAVGLNEDVAVQHGLVKPGGYALIAVSDSGCGMDEKTRDKIFEPFYTTKELGKGTGLGLAIVYGIVKQHNGHVNVLSQSGQGTTFNIYLPLIAVELERDRAEMTDLPPGGDETILLAEDDAAVRDLIKTVLTEQGYRVIGAVDGQDALDKFGAQPQAIDLLVLDVIMPRRSGKEVYDAVRIARPDLDALFISGYTAEVIHKKGVFEEGINFIAKPVSPNELLKKMREVLDKNKKRN